jgi:putative membrane protein
MMRGRAFVVGAVALAGLFSLGSIAAAQQSEPAQQRDSTEKGAPKQKDAASKSTAPLSRSERKFIEKVAEAGHAEVELGRLAQERATSDAIKQFGRRMVDDHGAASQELTQLASSKGVQLKDKTGKHERQREKLSRLQANSFDRAYVKTMVKEHKDDVAEFRKMSREAKDPQLKAWVDKTLPTLEEHLKTIESIQTQM